MCVVASRRPADGPQYYRAYIALTSGRLTVPGTSGRLSVDSGEISRFCLSVLGMRSRAEGADDGLHYNLARG